MKTDWSKLYVVAALLALAFAIIEEQPMFILITLGLAVLAVITDKSW